VARLLELISINSRIDYVALSSKTNLSANAVKYRIKQLEKAGVIEGETISSDVTKLGYEFYNLQIKLEPSRNENKIKGFFRAHPKIIYFYSYFGHENWDIDIGIIARNSKELREIIMEFRNNLGRMMIIHDVYHTLEIVKANIASKGVFE
jgi:DNA-binding Lrp family transcriptional regulator